MFGVAVLVFVYGVLQLVLHGADESARAKGKSKKLRPCNASLTITSSEYHIAGRHGPKIKAKN